MIHGKNSGSGCAELCHRGRERILHTGLVVIRATCALVCFAACSAAPVANDGGNDAGPPQAEIGTGDTAFEPLVDGQTVDLHMGCQGGYHVWGSVRARNLDPRSPVLDFTMTRVLDGGPTDVLYAPIHVRSTLTQEGTTDWYDGYAYTLRVASPDLVLDEDVVVGVTVTDRTGLQASDMRRVHVVSGASACTTDAATFDALDAGTTD